MAKAQRIAKWGNSLAVRIPQNLAEQAGLSQGAPIEVTASRGKLVIVPKIPEYDIKELVRKITKENRHDLLDWGPPVGKEIW
jgi:antitoxin MazE